MPGLVQFTAFASYEDRSTITPGGDDGSSCSAGDANHDKSMTIDEILTAVNNALSGCIQNP